MSYYEITVSKDKKHFFTTAQGSWVTELEMKNVYDELVKRFPESEGFELMITRWENIGYRVDSKNYLEV